MMLPIIPNKPVVSPAMASALAAIDREFSASAAIRAFKATIRSVIADPGHPAVRARYAGRARQLAGWSLDLAVVATETRYRHERKAFQVAAAFGGGTRLSVTVLAEQRLILRWMRRHGMAQHFTAITGAFEPHL